MRARTHISLPVSNVKSSIEFYSKVFKTQPTKVKEDYANFRLEGPVDLHLALVETPGLEKRTMENTNGQHFGIELFDDKHLQEWKKLVEDAGIKTYLEEEEVTCCYAVADKFWLQDPDGNQWEFWVRQDDDGASLFPEDAKVSACCVPTVESKPEAASCCG